MQNDAATAECKNDFRAKQFFRKLFCSQNSCFWFAFFIPMLLLLLVYRQNGIAPFGDASFLLNDLDEKVPDLYRALHGMIFGNAAFPSPLLTGDVALAEWIPFACSPFSYLVALFPETQMANGVLLSVLMQCGFTGLTFAIYMRLCHGTSPILSVIGACLYSLSAFSVLSAHLPNLAVTVMLFPLVMAGMDFLIRKRNPLLFTLSLATSVITDPEISLLLLAALAVLFLFSFAAKTKEEYSVPGETHHFAFASARFGIAVFFAIGLSLCVLLPIGFWHFGSAAETAVFQTDFKLIEFLVKCFPSYDSVGSVGTPFLYFGVLGLLSLVLFFLRNDVPARKKICAFAFLLLSALFMMFEPLNLLLHGFTLPLFLNYRYAFLPLFVCCVLATTTSDKPEHLSARSVFAVAGFAGIVLILLQKLDLTFTVSGSTTPVLSDLSGVWLSVAALIVYTFILLALREKTKFIPILRVLLACVLLAEFFFSSSALIGNVEKEKGHLSSSEFYDVAPILQAGTPAYRFVRMDRLVKNGKLQADTPLEDLADYQRYFGLSSPFFSGNPLLDSFFGLRYQITDNNDSGDDLVLLTPIAETSDTPAYTEKEADTKEPLLLYLAQNEHALPVVFASERVETVPEGNTPFARINALFSTLSGEANDVWEEVSPASVREEEGFFALQTATSTHLYLCFQMTNPAATATVTVNSQTRAEGYLSGCIVDLGSATAESVRKVTIKVTGGELDPDSVVFCTINEVIAENTLNILRSAGITDLVVDSHRLSGTVHGNAGGSTVMTTLPANADLRVTVDGNTVDTVSVGGLLAFDIPEGDHNVSIRYRKTTAVAGTIVFTVFFLLATTIVILWWFFRKGKIAPPGWVAHLLPLFPSATASITAEKGKEDTDESR